ncbi:MAG: putative selenium-dependent hydroxylase accessory protein YqeC, partial [Desulfobacterales bacterium]|nr:putative selenium-dependent hydroxylase accessory protein YqeC [Desulfobacterales bacterium]
GKTSLMFRLAHELAADGEPVLTTTTTRILTPTQAQSPRVILSPFPGELLQQAESVLKHTPHVTAAAKKIYDQRDKLMGFKPEVIDSLKASGVFRWIIVEADGAARKPLKAPAPHEPVIPHSTDWLVGVIGLNSVGKPLSDEWVFRPELYIEITGLAPGDPVTEASIAASITHEQGIMKGCTADVARIAFLNMADNRARLEAGRTIVQLLLKNKNNRLKRIVIGKALRDPPVVESIETE